MSKYILIILLVIGVGCGEEPPKFMPRLGKPASTERVCAEMRGAYEAGGAEGVRKWLGPKAMQSNLLGEDYYTRSRVVACIIEVSRGGK